MEVISASVVNFHLRTYLESLRGEELLRLRNTLLSAGSIEQLPDELRENLQLQNYLLTRNLPHLILTEFDKLITFRCLKGDLVPPDSKKLIGVVIQESLQIYLEEWKQVESYSYLSPEWYSLSPEMQQYANYLFQKIRDTWFSEFHVTPKVDAKEITLVVQHPVLRLSHCQVKLNQWMEILKDGIFTEIHFVAKELFLVDCSLDRSKWHGKNILIITKKMECNDNYTWDLSAQNRGENGGNVLVVCKDYSDLKNLQIIFTTSQVDENEKHGMNFGKKILGLFPPSVHSDTLRKLVLENAIALKDELNDLKFDYEPTSAYDPISGKVTGNIHEFYMEGKMEDETQLWMGFHKGYFTRNSFCLVKSGRGRTTPGKPGTGRLVTLENPGEIVPLEQVGWKVTAIIETANVRGHDVGYMQLNAKTTMEFPPGTYQIHMECKEMSDSVHCKLLDRYIKICEIQDDSEPSSTIHQQEERTIFFPDPQKAVQLYGNVVGSEADAREMDELLSKYEVEWWTRQMQSKHNDNEI